MTEPGYPVGAVDRALRLLVLLHERGQVRVQDVAADLGVAPSTAHRLLAMLRYRHFVVQDRQHVYRPGPALRGLAARPSHRPDLPRVAHPHLAELARRTGETAHLMVLEGSGARFVDGVDGSYTVRVAPRVGVLLPAHLTSGGKVLLAELSRQELAELYPYGLPLTPDATGPDLAALRRELVAVRRRGYAYNVEESEQGVNAIGSPVRGSDGRAVAAVVLAAPSMRVNRRRLPALAEPLLQAATAISVALAAG